METSTLRKVERILIVTCCLIIAPAIPKENSELNSENNVQVPGFHYLSEDSSKEDTWNYHYPRFSMPVQEKSQESKRRSSFFPVRGKKNMQNVHLFNGKSVPENVFDDDQRSSIFSQHSLENIADAISLVDPVKWASPQKRPSSFMPMRGRKRHLGGDNMKILEQYLSSKAHDERLHPSYKDMIFHRPVYSGIRKIDADKKDKTNYPNYDKSTKGELNFLDRNQVEKYFKFITDDSSGEEIENGNTASNPNFFSSEKIPEKRALSFVPTRGRREKLREIESDLGIPHTVVELSDVFPAGEISANLSRYAYQAGGKYHQRYRRASAFMPMRGRKSLLSPYGPSGYLSVDHVRSFGDTGRSNSIYDVEQELPEISGLQGSFDDKGDQREKRHFGGTRVQTPVTQQKLRTALVMKRPLSFFAARGKRLNLSGIDVL